MRWERAWSPHHVPVLDIDAQGSAQVRERTADAVHVMVLPPDQASLEERLRARGTEDERPVAALIIAVSAGRLRLDGDIIVGKDIVLNYLLLRLLLELELGIVFVQGRHDVDKWHELCWPGNQSTQ